MNIGLISNSFFNIYHFRGPLLEYLLSKKVQVIAIASVDNYKKKLMDMGCVCIDIKFYGKGYTPIDDMAVIYQIYKILKKESIPIILSFTIKPNIYVNLASYFYPTIVLSTITGLGSAIIRRGLISRLIFFLYRIAFRKVHHVFFQNKEDQYLFSKKKIINIEKTSLIPGSGVNLKKFQADPIAPPITDRIQFLMVSRLIYEKGIYEYIEAIKIIKKKYENISFQLIGSFDGEAKFNILEKDLKLWQKEQYIEYLPFQENIIKWIGKADCIVLPSYREGTSKVLLEALAMGKPIITTHVPGCKEIVADQHNGFLCKVKDAKDLAKKMEKFIHTPYKKRIEMGNKGRKRAEKYFDQNIVINKYNEKINAYQQLLHTDI